MPMMRKKNNIVVGLTTVNTDLLRISVPALGRLRQKFMLVIYNDNPMETVSRRQIRRLGYCGDLQIINGTENIGTLGARMAIADAAMCSGQMPEWVIYCDDDDILTDLEIPGVSPDNFAIIQNTIVIRHRVCELLHAMDNPSDIDIDGENTILMRPHIGFAGTLVRGKTLRKMFIVVGTVVDAIRKIDDSLDWRAPVDMMMWSYLNMFARHENPDAVPIYMDQVNYIKNEIDTSRIKYGRLARPVRNVDEHLRRVLAKYDALMRTALDAAARQG